MNDHLDRYTELVIRLAQYKGDDAIYIASLSKEIASVKERLLDDNNDVAKEVTAFLLERNIPKPMQDLSYRLEIAYRMGYADAVGNFAIHKDGDRLVGAMQLPLKNVLNAFANQTIPRRFG